MFGLTDKGYLGTITKATIQEKIVERDRRRQLSMFRSPVFFVGDEEEFEEEEEDGPI